MNTGLGNIEVQIGMAREVGFDAAGHLAKQKGQAILKQWRNPCVELQVHRRRLDKAHTRSNGSESGGVQGAMFCHMDSRNQMQMESAAPVQGKASFDKATGAKNIHFG